MDRMKDIPEETTLEHGEVPGLTLRALAASDLDRLVRMDEIITGRSRRQWFETKLKRALEETDVGISLGAEKDGLLVGALMGAVHYGEFGMFEPAAVLDTMLIDREFAGIGIGRALFHQFASNLRGLRIGTVRTEVAWNELDLIGFFNKVGFTPAPRLVLECEIDPDAKERTR